MSILGQTIATALKQFPNISGVKDRGTRNALDAIVHNLKVYQGTAPNSNTLDTVLTKRDLYDAGIIDLEGFGGKTIVVGESIPGGSGSAAPDLTVPPAPTGFIVYGGFAVNVIEFDSPNAAYSNHAFTEIWRAEVDDVGLATMIDTTLGSLYSDPVGSSATRYYWIRFVSSSDVTGNFNAVAGTVGETGHDPAYVLNNMIVKWLASNTYPLNSYVMPTRSSETGLWYKATAVTGPSGLTQPVWPTVIGQTVTDGGITWTAIAAGSEVVPFIIGEIAGNPAVVMNAAYIENATITVAKIQTAFMDSLVSAQGTLVTAHIGTGQITNALIGQSIQSTIYNPATGTGWLIDKLGAITAGAIKILDSTGGTILESGTNTFGAAISNSANGGGSNLLTNSQFDRYATTTANGATGSVPADWVPWDDNQWGVEPAHAFRGHDTWSPPEGCHQIYQGNAGASGVGDLYHNVLVPVEPGKSYGLAVYTAAHRCQVQLVINYYAGDKATWMGSGSGAAITPAAGGNALEIFTRAFQKSVAPTGAGFARISLRKLGTNSGGDSYGWFLKPMFGEVGVDQVDPPAYALGFDGFTPGADVTSANTAAAISGQGALATSNTADYATQVGGVKPPSNADNTASNTAAGIAGQTAFATLSQINATNISTYIAGASIDYLQVKDAAIRYAAIQDAAVGTLKIAGQAVTIPYSIHTSASVNLATIPWTTIQTATFTSSGNPVVVTVSFTLKHTVNVASGDDSTVYLVIYRDATVVWASTIVGTHNDSNGLNKYETVSVSTKDQPPSGSVNYYAKAYQAGVGGASVASRTIVTLEVKR